MRGLGDYHGRDGLLRTDSRTGNPGCGIDNGSADADEVPGTYVGADSETHRCTHSDSGPVHDPRADPAIVLNQQGRDAGRCPVAPELGQHTGHPYNGDAESRLRGSAAPPTKNMKTKAINATGNGVATRVLPAGVFLDLVKGLDASCGHGFGRIASGGFRNRRNVLQAMPKFPVTPRMDRPAPFIS